MTPFNLKEEKNLRLPKAMTGAGFHNMPLEIESFSDGLLKSPSIAKRDVWVVRTGDI
ncbi:MAG: hypothetical protein VYA69_12385 [Gemmatimonadota bacterium]|nr:hypothetical protein [Gemmatimonadota bacterium]